MPGMRPDASHEDIVRELTEEARTLWGQERAEALGASLEQTAQQLGDVGRTLPPREVEPGFYQ